MANQVPGHCGQLLGGLRVHLHVVLEETLPERGLVVGLVRLGLDGRPQADRAALSLAVTRTVLASGPCTVTGTVTLAPPVTGPRLFRLLRGTQASHSVTV